MFRFHLPYFLLEVLAIGAINLNPVIAQVTGSYPVQLAQPTGSSNALNGSQTSAYPECALECAGVTSILNLCQDSTDTRCQCSPENRGNTSACQVLTCNDADYQRTQLLTADLCGSLYEADASLSSAVSGSIASATSSAQAVLATVDPLTRSDLPACGQTCLAKAFASGACASVADRTCTCHCATFNQIVGECELSTCSNDDLNVLLFAAEVLCAPVGGVGNLSPSACTGNTSTISTSTGAGSQPTSPIAPYTGAGLGLSTGSTGMLMAVFILGVLTTAYLL